MPIISSRMASLGIASIPLGDPFRQTVEEQTLEEAWINKYAIIPFISLSQVLDELDSLLSLSSTKTIPQVLSEITAIGRQLFNTGAQIAKSHFDDRPLYHARLSAQVKLKRFISKLPATADLYIEFPDVRVRLEASSRNLDNIDFSTAPMGRKKVIITGFDPYLISRNSNASGNIALALHGETISNSDNIKATIQSCLVPTRWQDFDEGIIEAHLAEFIENPSKRVDMILSLSLDDSLNDLKTAVVERFATVARGTSTRHKDNNDVQNKVDHSVELAKVVVTTPFGDKPAWTQSTLPTDLIDSSSLWATIFKIHLRESYTHTNDKVKFGEFGLLTCLEIPHEIWGKKRTLDTTIISSDAKYVDYQDPIFVDHFRELRRSDLLTEGSGGDFLSNEIFYRIALIRERRQSTIDEDTPNMSTGHIHVPAIMPNDETGSTNHIDSLTTLLRERLKACIVPTGYFQNKLLP